jgi:hypothetical protein
MSELLGSIIAVVFGIFLMITIKKAHKENPKRFISTHNIKVTVLGVMLILLGLYVIIQYLISD